MTKLIKRYLQNNLANFILLLVSLASGLSLLFTDYNNTYIKLTSVVFTIFCNIFFLNLITLPFCKFKKALKIFLIFLVNISIVLIYASAIRGFSLTPSLLLALFITNVNEVKAIISLADIAICLTLTSLASIAILKAKNITFKFNYKVFTLSFLICLLLSLSLTPKLINKDMPESNERRKKPYRFYYITNFELSSPFAFFSSFAKLGFTLFNTKASTPITLFYSPKTFDNDLVIIYLIGETLRFDRLSINGNKNNTTPNLIKQAKLGKLFNFGKEPSKSCDTMTLLSTPCMLSGSQDGTQYDLFKVFKTAGFESFFYSVHSARNLKPIKASVYKNATHKFNAFYNDLEIPAAIKSIINKNQGKKMFIAMQMLGSHNIGVENILSSKYPDRILKPYCKSPDISHCETQVMFNSYDNTVTLTDIMLGDFFEIVKDKNAIVFFSSDHGQILGEDGNFGHGITKPDGTKPSLQYNVPAFIWMSEKYQQLHPQIHKQILAASKKGSTNHLQIYQSIIACSGIKPDGLDLKNAFCKI